MQQNCQIQCSKKMQKVTKNDIYFDEMSFKTRIIIITLQKIDYLIQKNDFLLFHQQ